MKEQIIGGIVLLVVIYIILERMGFVKGIFESDEDTQKDKIKESILDNLTASAYMLQSKGADPNYYKKAKTWNSLLEPSQALEIATDLHSALTGWFGDNEKMVYSSFERMSNMYQLSQVVESYQAQYNNNLIVKLTDDLTDKELLNVVSIISRWNDQ